MKHSCWGCEYSWEEGRGWLHLNSGSNGKEVCHWLRWPIDLCSLEKFRLPVCIVAIGVMDIKDPVRFGCLVEGRNPVEYGCIAVGCSMDVCARSKC